MEAKPNFCSECGAKLTGSAAFCPACGAKQAHTVVTPAPQAAPAPAPVAAPVVTPAPAPTPTPVVTPVSVPVIPPENALAAPAKVSVPAILLGVVSLALVLIAILMTTFSRANLAMYRGEFGMLMRYVWQTQGWGFLAAWIVPLVALVAAFFKKKPVAIIGLALAALSIMMQLITMILYRPILLGQIRSLLVGPLFRIINGESLFYQMKGIFSLPFSIQAWRMYLSLAVHSGFVWKNVLSLLACLLVVTKKKK